MEVKDKIMIIFDEVEKELKELREFVERENIVKLGGKIKAKISEDIIEESKKSLFKVS